jgi:hypothetical protein
VAIGNLCSPAHKSNSHRAQSVRKQLIQRSRVLVAKLIVTSWWRYFPPYIGFGSNPLFVAAYAEKCCKQPGPPTTPPLRLVPLSAKELNCFTMHYKCKKPPGLVKLVKTLTNSKGVHGQQATGLITKNNKMLHIHSVTTNTDPLLVSACCSHRKECIISFFVFF